MNEIYIFNQFLDSLISAKDSEGIILAWLNDDGEVMTNMCGTKPGFLKILNELEEEKKEIEKETWN